MGERDWDGGRCVLWFWSREKAGGFGMYFSVGSGGFVFIV